MRRKIGTRTFSKDYDEYMVRTNVSVRHTIARSMSLAQSRELKAKCGCMVVTSSAYASILSCRLSRSVVAPKPLMRAM